MIASIYFKCWHFWNPSLWLFCTIRGLTISIRFHVSFRWNTLSRYKLSMDSRNWFKISDWIHSFPSSKVSFHYEYYWVNSTYWLSLCFAFTFDIEVLMGEMQFCSQARQIFFLLKWCGYTSKKVLHQRFKQLIKESIRTA